MTYLGDIEANSALTPLQAASYTYRIALGSRAGQKVLSLQTVPSRPAPSPQALRANTHGFSRTGTRACTRGCVAAPISARRSNTCAAPSPARRLPMSGSSATAPAKKLVPNLIGDRAATQERLPGRHHSHRDVAAGIHAAARRARSPSTAASDPLPRRARPPR